MPDMKRAFIESAEDLLNIFGLLIDENDQLKKRVKELEKHNNDLSEEIERWKNNYRKSLEYFNTITPVKVYHSKKKGNTTVKFADGRSVTVHRMKRDKDCLETAIVYALFKRNYPKRLLNQLVSEVTETEEDECKKDCKN